MATWAENWASLKLDLARLTASCAAVKAEVTGLAGRLREAFAPYPPVADDETLPAPETDDEEAP